MTRTSTQGRLRAGVAPLALFIAFASTAAHAQDATAPAADDQAQTATTPAPAAVAQAGDQSTSAQQPADIVVTGTMFRRTDTETPSPVTVLSADHLAKSGITNVADAVRSIAADNSGSIPTAFANGFGSGSAAVSLRGLSVNSTLVLIDGMRTANYPYADDGQRSFVDLNSIPQSTIDRVEVLKDGASSTYGADAIGGVVNIITRKEIKGIEGTAEAGVSQRGDGGEQRVTLTGGYGDLAEQGFNVYLNGEYERDSMIRNFDRGFPYNTADLSSIGGEDFNVGVGGAFAALTGTTTAVVRPATESEAGNIFSGVAVPNGTTQILGGTCGAGQIQHNDSTGAYCEQNLARLGTIQPQQTRYGFTGHGTFNVGDNSQAYLTGTYYHSSVLSENAPWRIRQRNPINTTNVVLPAILSDGTVNPQNPYAVAGCVEGVDCVDAQLTYTFGDIPQTSKTDDDLYRAAAGINGSFGGGWQYSFDATYARSELTGTQTGYLNIQGLTNAIEDGTYNFVDPSQNNQAVLDSISPAVKTKATSELYMAQGTVSKDLVDLPGGALQLGVGGSIRHESLDNPNANANQAFLGLNAVTASGKHWVEAAYFELDAPILTQLDVNLSGRYDHYSEGYGHFSPKIGAKFTPFKQLAIRGTYSRGFRAPTFAEINQGAVIGYTSATLPCSVAVQHGATQGADGKCTGGSPYTNPYSIGYNSTANPNIKPELSRSFTGGVVFQPFRWLSMTADYYNIKKTRVITGGPLAGTAIANYYAGQALPDGYTLVLDDADPAYPDAIRRIVQVNSPYANASALKTSGLDVSVLAQFKSDSGFSFSSQLEVTDIFNYDFKPSADSPYDHYVGTQAPYVLSSGAGTPKWRGNWQNSVTFDRFTLTGTAYYTSGYKAVAVDQYGYDDAGNVTCANDGTYNGSFNCHTKHFVDVDLVGQYKVNDDFTFYMNVINLFDAKAPLNAGNYAGVNYNPTWSQQGVIGRYFRAGATFKF